MRLNEFSDELRKIDDRLFLKGIKNNLYVCYKTDDGAEIQLWNLNSNHEDIVTEMLYLNDQKTDDLAELVNSFLADIKNYDIEPKLTGFITTMANSNCNEFAKYTNHLAKILQEKNDAYGDSFTESVDKFGLVAIPVRLSDKFNRVCELIKKGELKENDESLEDTLLDMAGYSILALKYLKEHENA